MGVRERDSERQRPNTRDRAHVTPEKKKIADEALEWSESERERVRVREEQSDRTHATEPT